MKMKLAGSLKIEVGGMSTDVELDQTQDSITKTMDADPTKKAAPAK
jgi:hypothetical protein